MCHDSPPPSWYEPDSSWDDDDQEPDPRHPELFILRDGVFWWTASEID
jgi:hypothetical protein